jgi:hypothetical protein
MLWQANAPVLGAIVENWHTDPRRTELWRQQMQTFTDAALNQISGDEQVLKRLEGMDIVAVVSSLTWHSERLYYSPPPARDPLMTRTRWSTPSCTSGRPLCTAREERIHRNPYTRFASLAA